MTLGHGSCNEMVVGSVLGSYTFTQRKSSQLPLHLHLPQMAQCKRVYFVSFCAQHMMVHFSSPLWCCRLHCIRHPNKLLYKSRTPRPMQPHQSFWS